MSKTTQAVAVQTQIIERDERKLPVITVRQRLNNSSALEREKSINTYINP